MIIKFSLFTINSIFKKFFYEKFILIITLKM